MDDVCLFILNCLLYRLPLDGPIQIWQDFYTLSCAYYEHVHYTFRIYAYAKLRWHWKYILIPEVYIRKSLRVLSPTHRVVWKIRSCNKTWCNMNNNEKVMTTLDLQDPTTGTDTNRPCSFEDKSEICNGDTYGLNNGDQERSQRMKLTEIWSKVKGTWFDMSPVADTLPHCGLD